MDQDNKDESSSVNFNDNIEKGNLGVEIAKKKKIPYLYVILSLVVLVIILGFFAETDFSKTQEQQLSEESFETEESLEATGVEIKYIDVKGRLLIASGGHYLSTDNVELKINPENPTLYYDGKQVLDTSLLSNEKRLLGNSSVFLSHNGLHYGFIISYIKLHPKEQGVYQELNQYDIYIDGKKVETVKGDMGGVYITDDGKDYFYITYTYDANRKFVTKLVKNGVVIYAATTKGGVSMSLPSYSGQISTDGKTTLMAYMLGENHSIYSVKLNNNEVYRSSDPNGVRNVPYLALSPNGKHYAMIIDGKLFVDGVERPLNTEFTMRSILDLQITDSGHYLVHHSPESEFPDDPINDTIPQEVFIDDKHYSFPYDNSTGLEVSINDDASHIISYDKRGWTLDNKKINSESINSKSHLELIGNTVYVYKADPVYIDVEDERIDWY